MEHGKFKQRPVDQVSDVLFGRHSNRAGAVPSRISCGERMESRQSGIRSHFWRTRVGRDADPGRRDHRCDPSQTRVDGCKSYDTSGRRNAADGAFEFDRGLCRTVSYRGFGRILGAHGGRNHAGSSRIGRIRSAVWEDSSVQLGRECVHSATGRVYQLPLRIPDDLRGGRISRYSGGGRAVHYRS